MYLVRRPWDLPATLRSIEADEGMFLTLGDEINEDLKCVWSISIGCFKDIDRSDDSLYARHTGL